MPDRLGADCTTVENNGGGEVFHDRRSISRVFHGLRFWYLDLDVAREIGREFRIVMHIRVFLLQFPS